MSPESVTVPAAGEKSAARLPSSPDNCSCGVIHEDRVLLARSAAPPAASIQALGDLFKVFADPTRLRILKALASSELCVCDLGEVLGMSQSAVSHQLSVLRAARLVRNRREGKVVYYALDDDHVKGILRVGLEHVAEAGGAP